jgi:Arc/MetJ-type ribon-helix-helix transcriptional regulator
MPITLTSALEDWLQAEVAAGRYGSVEAAVQSIVGHHIVKVCQDRAMQDRLAQETTWANGLIDQVRSRIAQGETETLVAFASFVQQHHGNGKA